MQCVFLLATVLAIQTDASDQQVSSESQLVGSWTYRSFVSDDKLTTPASNLVMGVWSLDIDSYRNGVFTGALTSAGTTLDLEGTFDDANPPVLRFRATGSVSGKTWSYEGEGYMVRQWQSGLDQKPALMGSIVQTSDSHGSAGYVSHWIAVKRPETKLPAADFELQHLIWDAHDTLGAPIHQMLDSERSNLVVFSQGFSCAHCSDQISALIALAPQFSNRNCNVLVVIPETDKSLKEKTVDLATKIRFVADPEQIGFTKFGCQATVPFHGTYLFNADGNCIFANKGHEPFNNFKELTVQLDRISKNQRTDEFSEVTDED